MNVSVLVPIRNGSRYIESCVRNLSNSAGSTDEIVVICNGCTDNSVELLQRFTNSDPRFQIFELGDVGLANALNFGVEQCSNEWIFRVDIDDEYDEKRFMEQKSLIEPQSNLVLIFSDYSFIGARSELLGYVPTAVYPSAVPVSLLSTTRSPHPVAAFRMDAFKEAGGYLQTDFPAEDLSLWLRMASVGDMKSIPKGLLRYRISSGSVTMNNRVDSLSVSHRLLDEHRLPQSRILNFSDELEGLLSAYSSLEYGPERIILLSRDLFLMKKFKYLSDREYMRMSMKVIPHLSLKHINAIKGLFDDSHLRRKYRNSSI